jgi:hypothetical protein
MHLACYNHFLLLPSSAKDSELLELLKKTGRKAETALIGGRWNQPSHYLYQDESEREQPEYKKLGIRPLALGVLKDYLQTGWDSASRAEHLKNVLKLGAAAKEYRWVLFRDAVDLMPDSELEPLIPEILKALENWPDEERYMPPHWIERIHQGIPDIRYQLASYLQIKDQDCLKNCLTHSQLFSHIRLLRPNHCSLGPAHAQQLADCPHLSNVQHLDLMYNQIGALGLSSLAQSPYLSKLQKLDIRHNMVGIGGITALIEAPWFANLTHLNVEHNELKIEGLKVLLEAPNLGALQELDISYNGLKSPTGKLIAGCTKLAGLKKLVLKYNDIKTGASALAKAKFQQLQHLDFGANEIGDKGVVALMRAPWIQSLEVLEIEGNYHKPLISDVGAQAIAAAPLSRLRVLNLEKNVIEGPGLQALVGSPNLSGLQELILGWNSLSAASLENLAKTIPAFTLKKLKLASFSVQGHPGIWQLPLFSGLQELDFPFAAMDAEDARALASSQTLSSLHTLNLMDSPIGDAGLACLIGPSALTSLKKLHLSYNTAPWGFSALPPSVRFPLALSPPPDSPALPEAPAAPDPPAIFWLPASPSPAAPPLPPPARLPLASRSASPPALPLNAPLLQKEAPILEKAPCSCFLLTHSTSSLKHSLSLTNA